MVAVMAQAMVATAVATVAGTDVTEADTDADTVVVWGTCFIHTLTLVLYAYIIYKCHEVKHTRHSRSRAHTPFAASSADKL
jgi:hypothetical protein